MSERLIVAVTEVLVDVARAGDTITYAELLDRLASIDQGLSAQAEEDLAPVLRAVSEAHDDAGGGLLTALVVRDADGLPGGGFFRLAAERGRTGDDRLALWTDEVARVHAAHSAG